MYPSAWKLTGLTIQRSNADLYEKLVLYTRLIPEMGTRSQHVLRAGPEVSVELALLKLRSFRMVV